MPYSMTLHQQAAQEAASVARLREENAGLEAIKHARQAVLLYALLMQPAEEGAEVSPSDIERPAEPRLELERADACQTCADILTEAQAHPEAIRLYQEAADLYSSIGAPKAMLQAAACAQKILAGIAALRARPEERLQLLIAGYERQQRQLALQPDTQIQQAAIVTHIARIFSRRERPEQALQRYEEALRLYAAAPPSAESALATAECHHRAAALLSGFSDSAAQAAGHYRHAIALYTEYEPVVYGEQSGRALCLLALADLEANEPREQPWEA